MESGIGITLSAGTAINSQLPPSTPLPITVNARHIHSWQPCPDPKIQMVHRTRSDPHQDLVFARLGIRNILVTKHLRSAEFMNDCCLHEQIPFGHDRENKPS